MLTQKLSQELSRKKRKFQSFGEYEIFIEKIKKKIQSQKLKINPFSEKIEKKFPNRIFRYVLNWIIKTYYISKPNWTKKTFQVRQQKKIITNLLKKCKNTEFGKKYNFWNISKIQEFQTTVPIHHYEDLSPYIIKTLKWEKDIIYPGKIPWFATSSWTTNTTSKYIPITYDNLKNSHYKGSQTLMSFYYKNNPKSKLFEWKIIVIWWSFCKNPYSDEKNVWFITAILQKNAPKISDYFKEPKNEISYISDRNEKISKILETTTSENITWISWSPVWCANFLQQIIAKTEKKHIQEIRPNLEVFIRWWMPINLYQEHFKKLLPKPETLYYQAYNASEWFFGAQIENNATDMLLLTNHWVFYEFIKIEDYQNENYIAKTLEQINTNQEYVIVITTNSGLRRYVIWDTIKFTSTDPFKIKVTWRTKYRIDLAWERLNQEKVENTLFQTLEYFKEKKSEFTVWSYKEWDKFGHHWVIENDKLLWKENIFASKIDEILCKDEYYNEERIISQTLLKPKITFIKIGTFYKLLENEKKIWWQYKIPKVCNNDQYIKKVLSITKN